MSKYNLVHQEDDNNIISSRNSEREYLSIDKVPISQDDKLELEGVNRAPWYSCLLSLASTIVGAGILGIPYAFSRAGWILGTINLALCSILSFFGLHLLALAAEKAPKPASYYTVSNAAIPGYSFIVDIAIAVKCFGIGTSYLIVIGDSLPAAMSQLNAPLFLQNRDLCVLLGFIVLAPLACFPSLDEVKHTTAISGLMILFLIFLVFLYSLGIPGVDPCLGTTYTECVGDTHWIFFNTQTLASLPIFLFGYSCQQNAFNVISELEEPTRWRMDSIFFFSTLSALLMYIVIAYCGYSTFGYNLMSDILKGYPGKPIQLNKL